MNDKVDQKGSAGELKLTCEHKTDDQGESVDNEFEEAAVAGDEENCQANAIASETTGVITPAEPPHSPTTTDSYMRKENLEHRKQESTDEDALLDYMTRLSMTSLKEARSAMTILADHLKKVARLEEKLRDIGECNVEYMLDPLPKDGETAGDLWDLKPKGRIEEDSIAYLAVIFQNDSPERWRNFDKLGSPVQALNTVRYRNVGDVLIQKYGIYMTPKHLRCLDGNRWLNDEVINFYIGMIQERNDYLTEKKVEGIPKCVCFNTFFFNLLCGGEDRSLSYNYRAVSRWTNRRKVDIFDMDVILIPVHAYRSHWCLGAVYMREGYRRILLFDSLQSSNRAFFTNIRRWLKDEHMDKKGKPLENIDDWKFKADCSAETVAPRQQNGYDCGVFLCQYAESLSIAKSFEFSQKDIPGLRVRMIQQILRGSIFT